MDVYTINSTNVEEVNDLVMTLIRTEAVDITVYNEFEENITDEIVKLRELKVRSMIKKSST